MNGRIFQLVMLASVLLPIMETGLLAYFWRSSLSRPWLFAVVGALGVYVLMGVAITYSFSNIGITGAAASEPQPMLDPVLVRYLGSMLAVAAAGFLMLWALRLMFLKTQ